MKTEDAFELCFPGLIKDEIDNNNNTSFKLSQMPYSLVFKDVSSYYENCFYCDQQRCDGCPVPYTDDFTI